MILLISSPLQAEYSKTEKKLALKIKKLRQKVDVLEEKLELWKKKSKVQEDKNSISRELNNKLQRMIEEQRLQHTEEIELYKQQLELLAAQKADWKQRATANNKLQWTQKGRWALYGAGLLAIIQVAGGNL